jgi:hypothetical protein
MKITKEQTLLAIKKAERELDILLGANVNHHRVHKNKKAYDRKESKKLTKVFAE